MRINGSFRARLLAGEFLAGSWLNLGSPLTAEMAGLSGFDWVMLDHEHGPGSDETIVSQLQAVAATPAVCFVRIAANEPPRFKRVLDLGAMGVMDRARDGRFGDRAGGRTAARADGGLTC